MLKVAFFAILWILAMHLILADDFVRADDSIFRGAGAVTLLDQNQDGTSDQSIGAFVVLEGDEKGNVEILDRGKIGFLGRSLYIEIDAKAILHKANVGPLHLVLNLKAVGREKMVRIDFPFLPRFGAEVDLPADGRVGILLIPMTAYGSRSGAQANMMSGMGMYYVQPITSQAQFEIYSDYYHTNGVSGEGKGYQLSSGMFVSFSSTVKKHHLEFRGELRRDMTNMDGLMLPSDGNGLEKDALAVFLSMIFR